MPGISMPIYSRDLGEAILSADITRCATKGLLFGLTIPAVTLYHGFTIRREITEIPRAGTRAVVGAMITVFALDALFALLTHA